MTISFNGVVLDSTDNECNFPEYPPGFLVSPVNVFNSNSRDGGVTMIDGKQSVPFTATYTMLNQNVNVPIDNYVALTNLVGYKATLLYNGVSVPNVVLTGLSQAQNLGAGHLACQLFFELVANNT